MCIRDRLRIGHPSGRATHRCNGGLSRRALDATALPKIVVPFADELLSGLLARLSNFNHFDLVALLGHVGIDGRYVDVLYFGLEESAAVRIADVARTDFERVQSLTISAVTPLEAELTAQFPFQKLSLIHI